MSSSADMRKGCMHEPFASALAHCQDMAERSLTKIGAFFHRPLSLASATVTLGNWNRKPLTQSSASFFCASPSPALYASRLGAEVTLAVIAWNAGLSYWK